MDFRTDKLLHGGDYNPEQWLKRPDILEKDIDMLEESGWSRKKVYFILNGCRKSLISFIKEEFLQFWLHLQVQDPNGWQINIRRCSV